MRAAVCAQRARRGQGRDRLARQGHPDREGGRVRRLHPRLHRPAEGRQRCLGAAGEVFGDTGRHARSAVGVPCCRSTYPSRWSSSSRSGTEAWTSPAPRRRSSTRRAPSRPARRPRWSRGTRRRWCCCGGPRPVPRSTCCAGRPDGVRRWHVRLSRRRCRPSRLPRRVAWAGPSAGEWARRLGSTSRWPGRWSARRCGRRSRSRACCSRAPRAIPSSRTRRRRLGGRPGRAGVTRAVDDRFPHPARAGPAYGPAGAWAGWTTPVFEPKRFGRGSSSRVLPRGR